MPEEDDRVISRGDGAPLRVDDPRGIRAWAHPARLAILDALSAGDELTATECAAVTGLSASATAYHLKFLERYGIIEPAPARRDGRERPWRTAARPITVDLDASTPAAASATSAVTGVYFDSTRAVGTEFIEGAHTEPEEWRNAAAMNTADLWLSVEEVQRVVQELAAVLDPYRGRTLRGTRPRGSRRVRVMNVVVPHRRTQPEPSVGRKDGTP
jgi:DNA-binding transcriptional ArsR family regulator